MVINWGMGWGSRESIEETEKKKKKRSVLANFLEVEDERYSEQALFTLTLFNFKLFLS